MSPRLFLAALALTVPALATPADAAPRGAARAKATPITVTVTNQRFIPDRISMRQGGAYTLRIRNASDRKHNFSAPSFFKYARVAQADSGWVTDNAVTLDPGQSATLHIVAPDTPNARYEYRSTRISDAAEKVKGVIYVR